MAYNEALAARIRASLNDRSRVVERKMFGGIGFMLNGNMCCGVIGDDLVLRLGNEGAAVAMQDPYTRAMDFTGKPMKSMVYVDPEGYRSEADLKSWLGRAVQYASTLPAK